MRSDFPWKWFLIHSWPTGQGTDDNRALHHQMVSPVLHWQSECLNVLSCLKNMNYTSVPSLDLHCSYAAPRWILQSFIIISQHFLLLSFWTQKHICSCFIIFLIRLTFCCCASYITDPFHPHPAFMGHLHTGGREDARCHGLYNPQVTQEWVWSWLNYLPCCAALNESGNQLHAHGCCCYTSECYFVDYIAGCLLVGCLLTGWLT